ADPEGAVGRGASRAARRERERTLAGLDADVGDGATVFVLDDTLEHARGDDDEVAEILIALAAEELVPRLEELVVGAAHHQLAVVADRVPEREATVGRRARVHDVDRDRRGRRRVRRLRGPGRGRDHDALARRAVAVDDAAAHREPRGAV